MGCSGHLAGSAGRTPAAGRRCDERPDHGREAGTSRVGGRLRLRFDEIQTPGQPCRDGRPRRRFHLRRSVGARVLRRPPTEAARRVPCPRARRRIGARGCRTVGRSAVVRGRRERADSKRLCHRPWVLTHRVPDRRTTPPRSVCRGAGGGLAPKVGEEAGRVVFSVTEYVVGSNHEQVEPSGRGPEHQRDHAPPDYALPCDPVHVSPPIAVGSGLARTPSWADDSESNRGYASSSRGAISSSHQYCGHDPTRHPRRRRVCSLSHRSALPTPT